MFLISYLNTNFQFNTYEKCRKRQQREAEKWYKAHGPERVAPVCLELLTGSHLERQQQHVRQKGEQHGLELHEKFALKPESCPFNQIEISLRESNTKN